MGPAAKAAVPAMTKVLEDPKVDYQIARRTLESLQAIDPEWATGPGGKERAAKLAAEFLKRSDADIEFLNAAAMLGPAAVPELVKRLSSTKPGQRRNILSSLRAAGPVAKDAIPAVLKYIKDPDAQVRGAAAEALGKMGPGNDDLLAPLAALLIDPEPAARRPVPEALGSVNKDWAKSPKLKEGLAQVLKALASGDLKVRTAAVEALDKIGPAEGAVAALEAMVKQEKDEAFKRYAEAVLDKLRKGA
jgi:HEAT repeat protein